MIESYLKSSPLSLSNYYMGYLLVCAMTPERLHRGGKLLCDIMQTLNSIEWFLHQSLEWHEPHLLPLNSLFHVISCDYDAQIMVIPAIACWLCLFQCLTIARTSFYGERETINARINSIAKLLEPHIIGVKSRLTLTMGGLFGYNFDVYEELEGVIITLDPAGLHRYLMSKITPNVVER